MATKYFCDRCGKETKADDMHRIRLSLDYHKYRDSSTSKEWCKECTEKLMPGSTDNYPNTFAVSATIGEKFEELIREIVREELPE